MRSAKTKRISFRVETNVKDKIREWAAAEHSTETDFTRRLFRWAFEQYVQVGELSALRKMVASKKQKSIRTGKEAV